MCYWTRIYCLPHIEHGFFVLVVAVGNGDDGALLLEDFLAFVVVVVVYRLASPFLITRKISGTKH